MITPAKAIVIVKATFDVMQNKYTETLRSAKVTSRGVIPRRPRA
jgi:hypothetical protein